VMQAPSWENDVTLTRAAEPQNEKEIPGKMAAGTGPVVTVPIVPVASPSGFSRAGTEISTLPAGFPLEFKEKMAWAGSDFPEPSRFVHVLDENEVAEIKAAVRAYKGKYPGPPWLSLDVHS
jgi:hypothetical protein